MRCVVLLSAPVALLLVSCSSRSSAAGGDGSTTSGAGSAGETSSSGSVATTQESSDSSGTSATETGGGATCERVILASEHEVNGAGASVSRAGDFNGDGLDDVVVSPPADPAYVVFGGSLDPDTALADVGGDVPGVRIEREPEGAFGRWSVAGGVDVDGDGLDDAIVGSADDPEGTDFNRAYVVLGTAESGTVFLGDVAAGQGGFALVRDEPVALGWAVSGARDVNADGLDDIVVAAPSASAPMFHSGRVYVVHGKQDTEPVVLEDLAGGDGGFVIDGELESSSVGYAASALGDVNGDGLGDVVVNSYSTIRTYVVFGKTDTDPVALADVAAGTGGFAIQPSGARPDCVSNAGDVNGDGLDDIAIGSRGAGGGVGAAWVVFGKTDTATVPLSTLVQDGAGLHIAGAASGDLAGDAVDIVPDIDGDGLAEVIVGAPYVDAASEDSGVAYVVFGRAEPAVIQLATLDQGSEGLVLDPLGGDKQFGKSVAAAGDVDGDGVPNLIVGSPNFQGGAGTMARAHLFSCVDR